MEKKLAFSGSTATGRNAMPKNGHKSETRRDQVPKAARGGKGSRMRTISKRYAQKNVEATENRLRREAEQRRCGGYPIDRSIGDANADR